MHNSHSVTLYYTKCTFWHSGNLQTSTGKSRNIRIKFKGLRKLNPWSNSDRFPKVGTTGLKTTEMTDM